MFEMGLIASAMTALTTYISTPLIARYMRDKEHIGIDVHKPSRPKVPTSCGLSIVIGLSTGCILVALGGDYVLKVKIIALLSSMLIAAAVGLIDDFKVLSGTVKTVMTLATILPIIVLSRMYPDIIVLGRPEVPIIGRLRLTIIYWLLLPLAIAGPANAVNMLEVLNGVMPITCGLATFGMMLGAAILGRWDGAIACALLLSALMAYLPYNKYPAKVFSGDVGSLSVGAMMGAIAVIFKLEIIAMAALSPHIMNAFYVIAFVRGFKEHRLIPRPTKVLGDGTIIDSGDPKAPITLVRMLAGREGAKENEIVKAIAIIECSSVLIALLLALLTSIR